MLNEISSHLHPIIVHFPIALITIGLGYDLVTSIIHRSLSPKQGLWLWLVAALGAWMSVATGPEEDAYGNTSFLDIHSTLADITAWIVTVMVVARLIMLIRGNRSLVKVTLSLYLVLSIASFALVLGTGYYGGKMVYSNGVGVKINGTMVNPPRANHQ